MKRLVITAALLAALTSGSAFAQGIPVYDNTSFLTLVQSFQQAQQTYSQLQTTYNSTVGSRGLSSLINNPAARQYLPSDFQGVLSGISTGSGDLSGLAKQILSNNSVLNSSQLAALSPANQQLIAAARNQNASLSAASQSAFSAATQRFTTLQTLIDSIDGETDPKAIQDLQARIQAENVMMQNENARLAAMSAASTQQQQVQMQADRERAVGFTNTAPPAF
ncbi:Minor pilin of type IV secretion complex, VirB5 [Candidatus Burkholderia verschuerenii]|uniref:Minor pilin of type IV secretion complex, VirB5 n=2 Tax=Candidatus Burkholderia verschuerenii TaxID=242163 RepID=A0A0L0MF81_9BURK|nr:Minor pilin of type IV secretion complex, VirB5 [Candidatus Burkholderia verschuerenii]